jgi:putative ABC transport system permease protein
MHVIGTWLLGIVRTRPARLIGMMVGVALGIALLASLGGFIDVSLRSMTRRALGNLPIDWQILLRTENSEEAVREIISQTQPESMASIMTYADVPGLAARTENTTQTTGAASVLGVAAKYQKTFPTEISSMLGASEGVLAAQQTAANLHVSVGDTVQIQRAGGLPAVDLKIDGIINLPDARSLFQTVGPGKSAQSPPDNVLVLPLEQWRSLFATQARLLPESCAWQVHVRTARRGLPAAPEDAYTWATRQGNHLEETLAGRGLLANNLAARLGNARGDALYARALFLFLGLPGLVVAGLLTLTIAGSGGRQRRQEQALLRTRGASIKTILLFAASEAIMVSLGGSLIGAALVLVVSSAFKITTGIALANLRAWLCLAMAAGLALALFALLLPSLRDARSSTVAQGRAPAPDRRSPLWLRTWLDGIVLVISGVYLWLMSRTGYELVLAPEGVTSVSVHYEAFAGPFCLWIGTILATVRLFKWTLKRGLSLVKGRRSLPWGGRVSSIVAASLIRQRLSLAYAMALVALAVSFAVSTAIFNATYQRQSRIDAQLTNGADVTVSEIPNEMQATQLVFQLEKLPTVVAARVMEHGYAYVGNDLQDIFGIDPRTISGAADLVDAYFPAGARQSLLTLASRPDGILVSDETVTDYQLRSGDELNLRLVDQHQQQSKNASFRFIGVVREFPTAPKDSFLIANSSYLVSLAPAGLSWTILLRSKGDPALLADKVRQLIGPASGINVSDVVSAQRQVSSGLAAVDLRGLTFLELGFAVVFVIGATGLKLFLSLSERKRSFALLTALGATPKDLAAFVWNEAALILSGGGVVGIVLGWIVAFALVKVLAGVFDPPPDNLAVPWLYLFSLCVCAVAVTATGVALLLKKLGRDEIVGELRSFGP